MSKFRRCVLHIGMEKTGTTTLQEFLGANRTLLFQKGFFVPATLSRLADTANHEKLTTYALRSDKLDDDRRILLGVTSTDKVERHREEVSSNLTAELALLPEAEVAKSILVLSNEHLQSRLTETDEVNNLRKFLQQFAQDFVIVIYLRPQHEVAISLYDTALKVGYAGIEMLPSFDPDRPQWVSQDYFDYAALIKRWETVFGIESLRIRIYAAQELVGGAIVEDFMDIVDCGLTGFHLPQDKNVAMSAVCQSALDLINRNTQHCPLPPATRDQLVEAFVRLSRGRGNGLKPSRVEACNFFQRFEEINNAVRQRYLPSREQLFFPDFSKYPVEVTCRPAEAEILTQISCLMARLLREISLSLPSPASVTDGDLLSR